MSLLKSAVQDAFKSERQELEALAWIKLVLELHPVHIKRKKQNRVASLKRGQEQQQQQHRDSQADDPWSSFHCHPPAPAPGPALGADT